MVARVRSYHEGQMRRVLASYTEDGLGVQVHAIETVGFYAPGNNPAYPSSVVHTVVPAAVAGVQNLILVSPAGPDGHVPPVKLAAAAIAGVHRVFAASGAQAIAALAYGTRSVEAVDVIVGPGNAYVQEAKRQLVGTVGIDGIAGPSELVVVASAGAEPELIALDLLAQAEHGEDSPLWCLSPERELLDAAGEQVERLAPQRSQIARGDVRGLHDECAHRESPSRAAPNVRPVCFR